MLTNCNRVPAARTPTICTGLRKMSSLYMEPRAILRAEKKTTGLYYLPADMINANCTQKSQNCISKLYTILVFLSAIG